MVATWLLVEQSVGRFEVIKGRRSLRDDMTQYEAISWVSRRLGPEDKVFLLEDDDYKVDITRMVRGKTRARRRY